MKNKILILSFAFTCMCIMSVAAAEKPAASKTKDEKPSVGMSHIAEVSFTHIDQFADLVPTVGVASMSELAVVKAFPTLEKHINVHPSDVQTVTSRYMRHAEHSPQLRS